MIAVSHHGVCVVVFLDDSGRSSVFCLFVCFSC